MTRIFRPSSILRALRADSRGTAAIEFAFVAPFLAVAFAGIADLGYNIYVKSALSSVARIGGHYAAAYPDDTAGVTAVVAQSWNLGTPTPSVSTVKICECDGAAATCGSTCSGGAIMRSRMQVTLTRTYSTLLSNTYFTRPSTLTATVHMATP
jgi:Flp pilus assembly protein TadG